MLDKSEKIITFYFIHMRVQICERLLQRKCKKKNNMNTALR